MRERKPDFIIESAEGQSADFPEPMTKEEADRSARELLAKVDRWLRRA